MSKPKVTIVTGQAQNIAYQVNKVADQLAEAIANRLMLDGSEPMQGSLDMNLNEIINVLGMSFKPGGTLDLTQTDVYISEGSNSGNPASLGQLSDEEDARAAADANLQSQISGGTPLEASAFSEISWHGQSVGNSVTIPDYKNAWSFGKYISIADGQTITLGTGSYWTVADGAPPELSNAQEILDKLKTVDGSGSGVDADLLDGQDSSYYLDFINFTNKPDPTITLGGDLSGSVTLTDLSNGTLTATVADDSHNHIIGNVDGLQTELNGKLNSIIEDTTPELGGELNSGLHSIGFTEKVNTSSAGAVTIDWKTSNKQTITLTENTTFTFTNPTNPCNLVLRILQDATGGWTVTMPAIKTAGGVALVFSTAANAEDLLMLYFDGTNYIGNLLQDVK